MAEKLILAFLLLLQGFTCAADPIPIPNEPYPGYQLIEFPPLVNDGRDHPLVMGLNFLPDGRMIFSTGFVDDDPRGTSTQSAVYVMSNYQGTDLSNVQVKKIADRFNSTIGITLVDQDVYIADRHKFFRLKDLDNFSNERDEIVTWPWSQRTGEPKWHHWGFTPVYKDGKFYVGLSGSIVPGGHSTTHAEAPEAGSLWEFDLQGNGRVFASGFRQPNGIDMDPYGRFFTTTEQGSWVPAPGLTHIQEGFSYGHRHQPNTEIDKWPYKPYSVYLPYRLAARSPGTPRYIYQGPYKGHWLYGDNNHMGLMRVFMENVGGELQGAVFHFSHGTGVSAINRIVWGPDGALYIGCLGVIAGNWPNEGHLRPMYKLIPTETATFDMFAVRSRRNGMEIEFTEPVDISRQDSWSFEVKNWGYEKDLEYGCCTVGDGSAAHRTVNSVQVSPDGKRVFLQIDGLISYDRVVEIKVDGIRAASGTDLWNNTAWYTLNAVSESNAFDVNGCVTPGYGEYNPEANFDDGTCMTPIINIGGNSDLGLNRLGSVETGSQLRVSVNVDGPHSIEVLTLDGSIAASRKGRGQREYTFSDLKRSTVYLVRTAADRRTFTRKVTLFQ